MENANKILIRSLKDYGLLKESFTSLFVLNVDDIITITRRLIERIKTGNWEYEDKKIPDSALARFKLANRNGFT